MNEWIYKIQPLNVSSDFMIPQADMDAVYDEGWEIFAVYNHPVMLLRKKDDGTGGVSSMSMETGGKKKSGSTQPSGSAKRGDADGKDKGEPTAASHYHKGTALLSQDQLPGAVEEYNKAIEMDPRFTMAYIFRANAFFKMKDFESAIEDFTKALELKPADLSCKINRGICRYENMDIKAAIEDFNSVIETDPGNTMAYEYRGQAYKRMKQYESAIHDFTKLINEFKDPHFYILRGDTKIDMKDYEGAIQDYSSLIEADSGNAIAYFKRSKAYSAMGDEEESKKDMKKYKALFNKNVASRDGKWGESAAPQSDGEASSGDDFEVIQ